tara:strand:- start:2939 stop:3175 length:237 start_codon:yes stop_codon:yes gene_type:complete
MFLHLGNAVSKFGVFLLHDRRPAFVFVTDYEAYHTNLIETLVHEMNEIVLCPTQVSGKPPVVLLEISSEFYSIKSNVT